MYTYIHTYIHTYTANWFQSNVYSSYNFMTLLARILTSDVGVMLRECNGSVELRSRVNDGLQYVKRSAWKGTVI